MIVYYDLCCDKEVASDSFDQKKLDGFKGIIEIQSKKIIFKEVEANTGGNASAGGGEDGDAEDEGVDAEEAKPVIDVVHAAHLEIAENLSAKDYKSMQKSYWKKLLAAINKDRYRALGIKVDEEDDKDTIKEKEAAAMAELSAFEKKAVEAAQERLKSFKANFEDLQKFVNDVVLANFDEFVFYLAEESELGEGMIIPARYIGAAEAPIFYFFEDGLKLKKE